MQDFTNGLTHVGSATEMYAVNANNLDACEKAIAMVREQPLAGAVFVGVTADGAICWGGGGEPHAMAYALEAVADEIAARKAT